MRTEKNNKEPVHGLTWDRLCRAGCHGESLDELLHTLYADYSDGKKELKANLKVFDDAISHLETAAHLMDGLSGTRLPIALFGMTFLETLGTLRLASARLNQPSSLPTPQKCFSTKNIRDSADNLKKFRDALKNGAKRSVDEAIGLLYAYCAECIAEFDPTFKLTGKVIADLISEERMGPINGWISADSVRSSLGRERLRFNEKDSEKIDKAT